MNLLQLREGFGAHYVGPLGRPSVSVVLVARSWPQRLRRSEPLLNVDYFAAVSPVREQVRFLHVCVNFCDK